MVGWALGQEWMWQNHPRGKWWVAISFSPESTPWRWWNPLEDHLWTTAACLQCSGSHHRMSRVRCPGSWWRQRNTGRVLYGPQETCPLFQQEERNLGRTRGSMGHKNKGTNEGNIFGQFFCHTSLGHWTRRRRNSTKWESWIQQGT